MAVCPEENLNTKEKSPTPFVVPASFTNALPSVCTDYSTTSDVNLFVTHGGPVVKSFSAGGVLQRTKSDSDSNVSVDSGACLDDSQLDNLQVHCKCPCGSTRFGHCIRNTPSVCAEARHSDTHSYPEINLCQGEDERIAKREMKRYLVSDTKNIKKIYATYFTAAYNWAEKIPKVKNSLRQTLRANSQSIESDSFEWLFEEVTKDANFINYDVIRDHIMKPCRNASGEEESQLRAEAEAAEAKFMEVFKEFAQHRVFSQPGDLDINPSTEEGVYKQLTVKIEENARLYTYENLSCLKRNIKDILNLPKQVILRTSSVREGCVEVRFDVRDQLADSIFCLNLSQKKALLESKITGLKFGTEVKYCCCQLTDDQVSSSFIKDLYQAANRAIFQHGEELRQHTNDCLYNKGQTSKCSMVNCAYCGETFGSCIYEYHSTFCEMREVSSDDTDSDGSECNRYSFKHAFTDHQTENLREKTKSSNEPSKVSQTQTKRCHAFGSDTSISTKKEMKENGEITTKQHHRSPPPVENIATMANTNDKRQAYKSQNTPKERQCNLPTTPVKNYRDSRNKQQTSYEKLSLPDFLKKHYQDIPLRIRVCKGFCSCNEELSISDGDQFNVHLLKYTITIAIEYENGSRCNVPLNSTIPFALLYNPHNDISKAMAGYKFDKVSDVLRMSSLPPLLWSRRGHQGSSPDSSISANELLIVRTACSKLLGKQSLKVYSLTANKDKVLSSNCVGHFSTKPRYVSLYLAEIHSHMPDVFPCKAVMFNKPDDIARQKQADSTFELSVPKVITMLHSKEETSLVVTSVHNQDPKDAKPQNIPVDLDILVCVEENVDSNVGSIQECSEVSMTASPKLEKNPHFHEGQSKSDLKESDSAECPPDISSHSNDVLSGAHRQELSQPACTRAPSLFTDFTDPNLRPPLPPPKNDKKVSSRSKRSHNYSYVQVHPRSTRALNSAEHMPSRRRAAQPSIQTSLLSSSAPDPNVSDTSSFGSTGSGGAYVVSHQGSASEETRENCSSAAHREVTQTARYASAPARSDSSTFDDDPKQMYKVLDSCLVATDSTRLGGGLLTEKQKTSITPKTVRSKECLRVLENAQTSKASKRSNDYCYVDTHPRTTRARTSDDKILKSRGAAQPSDQSLIRSNSAPDSTVPDMSSFGKSDSDGAYVTLFRKNASEGTYQLQKLLLEKLLNEYSLTLRDIAEEVSDEHINEIYSQIEGWELFEQQLGLKRSNIQARKDNYKKDTRLHTMQTEWTLNKRTTTYGILLEGLLGCGHSNVARNVCELLKKAKTSVY